MASYRASGSGGGSSGTGNRTVTVTTAIADDLLVVFVNVSANSGTTPTVTDDHADGLGTYTRIGTAAWGNLTPSACMSSVFVRDAKLGSTDTSFVITASTGSNTSGVVGWVAIQGMSRAGSSAIRSSGKQESQATGGTPAPALSQAALTGNVTLAACMSEDTTTTPNASWTERIEANQASPTIAVEVGSRDSGFTGTTITFGAACTSTTWASWALEIDGSAPTFTATAAVTISNQTCSASAEFDAPVYTATSAVTVPNQTASGSASFSLGSVSGTAAVSISGMTCSASGEFDAPIYTAVSTVSISNQTCLGAAEFDVPVYSATSAVTISNQVCVGVAEFDEPIYTATSAVIVTNTSCAGSALFAGSIQTANAAVTISNTECSGSGEFDVPVYTANASVTNSNTVCAGSGIFASAVFSGQVAATISNQACQGNATFTAPPQQNAVASAVITNQLCQGTALTGSTLRMGSISASISNMVCAAGGIAVTVKVTYGRWDSESLNPTTGTWNTYRRR